MKSIELKENIKENLKKTKDLCEYHLSVIDEKNTCFDLMPIKDRLFNVGVLELDFLNIKTIEETKVLVRVNINTDNTPFMCVNKNSFCEISSFLVDSVEELKDGEYNIIFDLRHKERDSFQIKLNHISYDYLFVSKNITINKTDGSWTI